MTVRYRAITRVGRFYGNLVESVRLYSEPLSHITIPGYGEVVGVRYDEGEINVSITFTKLEDMRNNALLVAVSPSQDSNIRAADRFEELTGIDLRPANSAFCKFVEEGLNESLDALNNSIKIISTWDRQNLADMCYPSLN